MPLTLRPAVEARFPQRVLVRVHRDARVVAAPAADRAGTLDQGGPAAAVGADREAPRDVDSADRDYVVVDPSGWPRIVLDQDGVRLLLYVDPSDLRTVAVQTAGLRVAPTGASSAGGDGITVYPGAPLVVLGSQADQVRVRLHDRHVRAEGWLPRAAIGFVFEPLSFPEAKPGDGAPHELRGPVAVVRRPGDSAFAQIASGALLAAMPLGPSQGGFTPVVVRAGRQLEHAAGPHLVYELHGLLPSAALGERIGGIGWGVAGEHLIGGAHREPLRRGTRLYDRPAGEMVGFVFRNSAARFDTPRPDGWQRVWLETPWGPQEIWTPRPSDTGG